MRQASLILAVLLCGLVSGTAYGISTSQFNYKLEKFMQQQKAEHMVEAMEAIGADMTNVTVAIRNKGNTVQVNGTVPTHDDLERINLVIKQFGPFKNLRNYVKVKPMDASGGIVVEMAVFKHIPEPTTETEPGETNDCPVCAANGSCEKLYAEREELLKQLRPLVKRRISDRYVVFDEKATAQLKRFREVSDLLDSSLCYTSDSTKKTELPAAETAQKTEPAVESK